LKSAPASVVGRRDAIIKDEPGEAEQRLSQVVSTKRVELQMVDLAAFDLREGDIKPEVKQEASFFS
jgi:predicted GTPase